MTSDPGEESTGLRSWGYAVIILLGSEKGGTGKTMLAVNLAVMRACQGYKVLLFDADIQGSATLWAAVRDEAQAEPHIPCVHNFEATLRHQVLEMERDYEDIIVDAGGQDSQSLRAAMVVADRLVIPFRASQFDVWGLDRMTSLIRESRAPNPTMDCLAVINMASSHPGVTETGEAQSILTQFESIRLACAVIRDRIAFRRATRDGLAVVEFKPADRKASAEMWSLYSEVLDA